MTVTRDAVLTALRGMTDPASGRDFVEAGLARALNVADGAVRFVMEIDPKYCDVIITRWQEFTGETATLEATGQTLAELKAERGQD